MTTYGSESSVLAGLQSAAPRHAAANASNGKFLSGLLAILAQHPDAADQGLGILQNVLGSIGAQQAQQQARTQERRAGASSLATNYATTEGATQSGLEGILQANYPNLANKPFGQNLLQGLGETIGGGGAGDFTPDDQAGLGGAVADAFTALTPDKQADPEELQKIVDLATAQAIAHGKNQQGQIAARNFAKLTLSRLAGQTRSEFVGNLYPDGPQSQLSPSTTAATIGPDLQGTLEQLGSYATNSGVIARPHDPNSSWWSHFNIFPDNG
jgi:hypothetical protein